MSKSITEVAVTNTFQNWLDKTNELIDLINNDVMTASPLGDTTIGNATLNGTFTATNVTADTLLRTDNISPRIGSTAISVIAPFNINTNQQILSTFTSSVGPSIALSDTVASWRVGFENTTNKNFIITAIGEGGVLRLSRSGNLSINGTVTASNFSGNLTGNVNGNVSGSANTVNSLTGRSTTELSEGSNLYFTTQRSRSSISVSGILSYNSTTGVISLTNATVRNLISGGTGVNYNSSSGAISIGQAVNTNSNVTFGNLVTTGTIASTGAISSQGDITAFASSSDIRKKENIVKIDDALNKISQINGYTYNFKGDTRKIAGVIAQEIEKVLPEVVYEIDDDDFGGKTKAVRYGNIVGLLIEAIKDLNSEIKELKKSK